MVEVNVKHGPFVQLIVESEFSEHASVQIVQDFITYKNFHAS